MRWKPFWIPALLALVAVACAPSAEPTPAPKRPEAPAKAAPTAARPTAEADKPAGAPAIDFSGKTIRFIVGFSAGGGYDTYTRTIAQHITKHIPGNPTVVVQNMTGGGSLVAANYLAKRADNDGLTVGDFSGGLVLQSALGAKGPQFQGDEFGWIGAPVTGTPACAVMGFTGAKTWEDVVARQEPLKIGGTRVGSTTGDMPTILKSLGDAPFNIVLGYDGTSKIRVAMQSREVDGACWSWESMRTTARAMLDAKGEDELIPVIFQGKAYDPELEGLPQITDVVEGENNVAAVKAWLGPYQFQRPLVLPPGTPEPILTMYREAFAKTMKDPEFLADAEKLELIISPVGGREIDKIVADILSTPSAAKEGLQFLVISS